MNQPFRWTEQRIARLATLLVAGTVVVFDVILLIVYLRTLASRLEPWP